MLKVPVLEIKFEFWTVYVKILRIREDFYCIFEISHGKVGGVLAPICC